MHAPSVNVSQCACSKLTRKKANAFDVNVNYAQPFSRTTYGKDVIDRKFDAGPTSILNIGYASYSRVNFTLEKA